MASFTGLVYGINQADTGGWDTPTIIGSLIAGYILLVAFVLVELHVTDSFDQDKGNEQNR